ncbi:MAG: low molecular weight protein arginine phosphatase [Candidatus Eremiobacterota bacterium]
MRVLFVCTGNTCRSPPASVLAESLGLEAGSAGLSAVAGWPASEPAQESARKLGLDLASHRSRRVDAEAVEAADLILTMTASHLAALLREFPQARGRAAQLGVYARLGVEALEAPPDPEADVPDPFGSSQGVYDDCAEAIRACLEALQAPVRRGESPREASSERP